MSTLTALAGSSDLVAIKQFSKLANYPNPCPFGQICRYYAPSGCDSGLTVHSACQEWKEQVEMNAAHMMTAGLRREFVAENEIRPGHPVLFICSKCCAQATLGDGGLHWKPLAEFTAQGKEESLWAEYEPVWPPSFICPTCRLPK